MSFDTTTGTPGFYTWLAASSAALGIGQLLASGEKLTARLVVGRTLVAGGLGLCSPLALAMFPTMPFAALVGLSCVLVTLGVAGVERLAQRFLGGV